MWRQPPLGFDIKNLKLTFNYSSFPWENSSPDGFLTVDLDVVLDKGLEYF